jgi:hypothetical protein
MRILLDVKDNKAMHLMEVLKGLSYVKTIPIENTETIEKTLLKNQIKDAVKELSLIRQGKLKGISAKDLLGNL